MKKLIKLIAISGLILGVISVGVSLHRSLQAQQSAATTDDVNNIVSMLKKQTPRGAAEGVGQAMPVTISQADQNSLAGAVAKLNRAQINGAIESIKIRMFQKQDQDMVQVSEVLGILQNAALSNK